MNFKIGAQWRKFTESGHPGWLQLLPKLRYSISEKEGDEVAGAKLVLAVEQDQPVRRVGPERHLNIERQVSVGQRVQRYVGHRRLGKVGHQARDNQDSGRLNLRHGVVRLADVCSGVLLSDRVNDKGGALDGNVSGDHTLQFAPVERHGSANRRGFSVAGQ